MKRAFGLAAAAILAVACGTTAPTLSSTVPSSSPVGASPSLISPSSTPSGSPLAASIPPTGIKPDPSLLDLVPASAAGATLTYDAQTTASVAADPSLEHDVSHLAIGLARPSGAAPDDQNLASVGVARLRDPATATADWFRNWRDTYDTAACAQAGGVVRHAQTQVSGLTAFVGSCANGVFTYHVLVAGGAIVVSITSLGPDDLGRKIVQKLRS